MGRMSICAFHARLWIVPVKVSPTFLKVPRVVVDIVSLRLRAAVRDLVTAWETGAGDAHPQGRNGVEDGLLLRGSASARRTTRHKERSAPPSRSGEKTQPGMDP